MDHGGWCPRGRLAEDGPIPPRYRLRETTSAAYTARTRKNVEDSDGTLLITRGDPTGGSALTARCAAELGKPFLHIDLDTQDEPVTAIRVWVDAESIAVLNVAGPRASGCPGIAADVETIVALVLA